MAIGDPSNPTRFGQGQHSTDSRNMWLRVFGGEVYQAFHQATSFHDKVELKTIAGGMRSARFPKIWKATAEYHQAGQEMLGNNIETHEVEISVDDFLVAHVALYELDEILSHFDVRQPFAQELGTALALKYDTNVARAIALSARDNGETPFPGGTVLEDAAFLRTGAIDGEAWVEGIKEAQRALFDKDVPSNMQRYMAVSKETYDAIKYAQSTRGDHFLVLNRDYNEWQRNSGGIQNYSEMLEIDSVLVFPTRQLPTTDESSDGSVYAKYRADYSKTSALMWTSMAAGTVMVKNITPEAFRDGRRIEWFMSSRMLAGHGTLRPECAVEFKTP